MNDNEKLQIGKLPAQNEALTRVNADLEKKLAELHAQNEHLKELVLEKTKELQANDTLLEETGRLANVGGWELDLETEQLAWTKETYRIHDLDYDAMPKLEAGIGFYHPEDQPVIIKLVENCIQSDTPFDVELRIITAKGRQIWVRAKGEKRVKDGKQLLGGSVLDVTERKLAEIELEKSANELKFAQVIAHMGNWEWDIENDKIHWSEELYRIYGFDPEKGPPTYEGIRELYCPEDGEIHHRAVQEAVEEGTPYELELRCNPHLGLDKVLLAKGRAKQNAEGKVTHLYGTVLDITKSKLAEQELQAVHQRLLTVLESTTDGFMEVKKDYTVTYINQPGLDTLQLESSQLLGKNLWEVFPPPHSAKFIKHYDEVIADQKPRQFEEYYEPLNIWFEIRVFPSGETLSAYFRSVTERKEREFELEKSRSLADAANKAKSEFIANMSHEIRTPLNGIQGNLQLLELTELDEEQCESVDMAMDSSNSLITIIGDILDFSKIEAGQVAVAQAEFEIESLLDSLTSTFASLAEQKGLQLKFEVHPDVPSKLIGDIGRIRQVLFNVIGNAIKFTEKGEVTIAIKILDNEDSSKVSLGFSVADTGIGIPEKSIQKLFDPFTQVDSSASRIYQGTGLGLSIVKRLVELMEGSIDIKSKLGKGTLVSFDLSLGGGCW